MTMLDETLSVRSQRVRPALRDPWSCPECLALGDVCVRHEALGLVVDVELSALLAEGDPARFDEFDQFEPQDDEPGFDETTAFDDVGGGWS